MHEEILFRKQRKNNSGHFPTSILFSRTKRRRATRSANGQSISTNETFLFIDGVRCQHFILYMVYFLAYQDYKKTSVLKKKYISNFLIITRKTMFPQNIFLTHSNSYEDIAWIYHVHDF